MKLSGRRTIPAPRARVWEALTDPDTLRRTVPGAQSVTRAAPDAFEVAAQVKLGPVSASLRGTLRLEDIDPPHACTLVGEGKGATGFAKGNARVRLSETETGDTLLEYDAESSVGGKIAQIGQRFLDAAAKRMTDEFFAALEAALAPADTAAPAAEPTPAASRFWHAKSRRAKLMGGAAIFVILSLFLYLLAV